MVQDKKCNFHGVSYLRCIVLAGYHTSEEAGLFEVKWKKVQDNIIGKWQNSWKIHIALLFYWGFVQRQEEWLLYFSSSKQKWTFLKRYVYKRWYISLSLFINRYSNSGMRTLILGLLREIPPQSEEYLQDISTPNWKGNSISKYSQIGVLYVDGSKYHLFLDI